MDVVLDALSSVFSEVITDAIVVVFITPTDVVSDFSELVPNLLLDGAVVEKVIFSNDVGSSDIKSMFV